VLDDNVHLVIPSCVLHEVKEMNEKIPGLLDVIMRFKIEECDHGKVLSPDQCIKTYIGKRNLKKYFVATQDAHLRLQLRRIPGVPLIFFDQNMVMLEKPSKASIEASKRVFNILFII
jgi:U3 small nucleolar RNA-associated protein 23